MKFRTRVLGVAACAVALCIAPQAEAKTFKVTTKQDEADPKCKKNDCSIREALAAAATKDGKDKVKVPKGRYVLETGQLEVSTEVNLTGAGAQKTTIDADGSGRVMDVSSGPTTVSKMTITGGNSQVMDGGDFPGDAGGILAISSNPITLSKVAVVGNQAQMGGGGVAAPLENMSSTHVKVKDSAVADNHVSGGAGDGMGGGLSIAGDLTMTNSTVAENTVENMVTTNRGGGISVMMNPAAAEGTGVTMLTLTNSTIAKNAITGAAMDGMGGGIGLTDPVMGAMVNIDARNTIVARNTVLGATEDCGMVTMGVTSTANLSSDETCLFEDDDSFEGVNPKLGKLKLNGGQTETMVPKGSSDAVDNGANNGCPNKDQRGVKRPQGNRCDIGAVEREK